MSASSFQEKEFNTKSFDGNLWKRIYNLAQPEHKDLKMLLLVNLAVGIMDALFPYLEKIGLDYFAVAEYRQNELTAYILVCAAGIAMTAFMVYQVFRLAGKVEMGFSFDVREKAFAHLQILSFSYYDTTPIGWLMARVTSDIARVAEIFGWSLMDFAYGFFNMLAVTIIMLIVNWKLAMLVLVFTPLLAFLCVFFQTKMLHNYRDVRRINSRITSSFNECISGAKTTKTLGIEEHNFHDFRDETREIRHASIRAAVLSSVFMPLILLIGALTSALLLNYGGRNVLSGILKFGTLMMFTQYAIQFYEPLKAIAGLIAEMQMAQANAERILSLLDAQPTVTDTPEVIEKYGTEIDPKIENYEEMIGNIIFDHVRFHYIEGEPVLKDFNLSVQQGQTIALVGETGSGKSTIVNLLCRFYEPVSGEIRIDGHRSQDRSIGWLHSNLGYVMQSPHLFSGTVKDNVRYGRLDATDEEIVEACKLVNAHSFITKLEKGYDSEVGEGGGLLSTGQKQLISFARAIIADPRLFVLDEATSSIDTESEKLIQDAIQKVLKGRTSFIIAHRLSTIVNSDLILVVRHGEVIEQGTHRELMKQHGYYYRLYTNQFIRQRQDEVMNQSALENA
ncbi:MAG: ABC transporter ATP-binding protein [Erysipelotrichia bacterium]|nr:ABC transporter ATP-binding protein [Erysipelotrichia bacterium]